MLYSGESSSQGVVKSKLRKGVSRGQKQCEIVGAHTHQHALTMSIPEKLGQSLDDVIAMEAGGKSEAVVRGGRPQKAAGAGGKVRIIISSRAPQQP